MRLALIAAVGRNGAIGKDNALLWHIPEDLKHFKALTLGKPVVMGRRTHQSIGRPLPGRPNIVVSRDPGFSPTGVTVARDLATALTLAERLAGELGGDEVMVIGGAEIYAQTLDRANRLYLTEVDQTPEADAFFPALDVAQWTEIAREPHQGYAFVVLARL